MHKRDPDSHWHQFGITYSLIQVTVVLLSGTIGPAVHPHTEFDRVGKKQTQLSTAIYLVCLDILRIFNHNNLYLIDHNTQ